MGGGHGLYAIGLCRHHPDLSAAAFDVPAGFEDVTRTPIRSGGPGDTLVRATKPGVGR